VTITATDAAGNLNTCTASFIVRDTTVPTITTCATNITGSANASCQAAVPNFTDAVVASDNCSATTVTQSPTIGTLVGLGTNTVTITATDAAGNLNTCMASFIVRDSTAPSITTCATNISASANASCQAAVPNFTNAVVAADNCSATTVTQSPTIGTLVGLGTNTVTITATDAAGNFNTCTASFIVRDTTVPTITTCATNITGSANGSCQAAVPNFANAVVASDNCSATTVTQSPTIGTLVGLGTNTVTISVADLNGNTNTCTASFIVRDTTAPTITCPANVTTNANAGLCYATGVALGSPTTSDNCGVASVSNDAPSQFAVGNTTVHWTVIDTSGNSNICSQTVAVVDNQPPTISCPANIVTNIPAGPSSTTSVALGTPVTSDNCGNLSVNNNAPASFSVGTTPVIWTVTDLGGNSRICTQQVTVTQDALASCYIVRGYDPVTTFAGCDPPTGTNERFWSGRVTLNGPVWDTSGEFIDFLDTGNMEMDENVTLVYEGSLRRLTLYYTDIDGISFDNILWTGLESGSGTSVYVKDGGCATISPVILDPCSTSGFDITTFEITAIAKEGNNIRVTWQCTAGMTNVLQVTSGTAGGSYSNNFTDLNPQIILNNTPSLVTTNFVHIGAATNAPARYYRIRLVP
jgi:hypothetical protein